MSSIGQLLPDSDLGLVPANGGKSVSPQSHFGYLTDFDESILLTILTTVTLLTRAANDSLVFTITEKAPTRILSRYEIGTPTQRS